MLKIEDAQDVTRETHPELYKGLDAVAGEFSDAWSVSLGYNHDGHTVVLRLKGKGDCYLTTDFQTAAHVQHIMRRVRAGIETPPKQTTLEPLRPT
jgi:hypothetical protein